MAVATTAIVEIGQYVEDVFAALNGIRGGEARTRVAIERELAKVARVYDCPLDEARDFIIDGCRKHYTDGWRDGKYGTYHSHSGPTVSTATWLNYSHYIGPVESRERLIYSVSRRSLTVVHHPLQPQRRDRKREQLKCEWLQGAGINNIEAPAIIVASRAFNGSMGLARIGPRVFLKAKRSATRFASRHDAYEAIMVYGNPGTALWDIVEVQV